ncbi:hypothetical protein A3K86_07810 [Photobacterium jeanii]|uniref:Uncharacterized protein n=1 Tax=Photobacterium jeanii TaxID=858640 RepID=A0A178KN90_9GAMM|nr:DUF1904 domain-containing protein [Photobacterium jeanii]OAN18757.1 hypothetical protein A3K86_07810 [Photobacterium jeanii]PST86302.1 DUF1904 domain-containing protein [Photobacterium jeanii]
MPHLRLRALDAHAVQSISKEIVDELQPLMDCPREDFTIEHISSTFMFDGAVSKAYPFVEVLWFDRGQEVKDEVAKKLTALVRKAVNNDEQDVAVIFSALTPASYYDNGEHY